MKTRRTYSPGRVAVAGWRWLYVLVVGLAIFLFFRHWAYDDPFITYRYARNLGDGLGFVYNPGERVLSTTTPLFTLLLAAMGLFWPDLPELANLIGAVCLGLGALFLWDLARTWELPVVGWTGLLLSPTFPLLITTLGSETPLYLALCLGAFATYARRRYPVTAALVGLAVLARPDGILVSVLLAGHYLLASCRAIPWRAVLIFSGILLAWIFFAQFYFGSPIPVTLAAKQQQGAMAISQRFAAGFLTILSWYASWPYYLEAVLAVLGGIYAAWRGRSWLLLLAWPVLYFAAYSLLGVSRYFWYYAPLVPGFIAAVGLGLAALARALSMTFRSIGAGERAISPAHRPVSLVGVLVACLLAALVFGQARSLIPLRAGVDNRFAIYRAVGEWLEAHTRPADRVGALEVGIIGYYARRPMVDFAGLIQPAVAAQIEEQSNYEDLARWAVDRYRPDYLVLHAGLFSSLEQGYAQMNCDLAERFPGERYGHSWDMDIYACRK